MGGLFVGFELVVEYVRFAALIAGKLFFPVVAVVFGEFFERWENLLTFLALVLFDVTLHRYEFNFSEKYRSVCKCTHRLKKGIFIIYLQVCR